MFSFPEKNHFAIIVYHTSNLSSRVRRIFLISIVAGLIINLQIFLANSLQILYTKDRDHTTGGKVGLPTGSMVNAADRLGRP